MKKLTLIAAAMAAAFGTNMPSYAGNCLASPFGSTSPVVSSGFGVYRCFFKNASGKTDASSDLTACTNMGGKVYKTQVHWGIDMLPANGNPNLYSAEDGKVVYAGFAANSGHIGNRVAFLRSNGDVYTYQHMASIEKSVIDGVGIKSGQKAALNDKGFSVNVGTLVGKMGGTGDDENKNSFAAHLHANYFKKVNLASAANGAFNPYKMGYSIAPNSIPPLNGLYNDQYKRIEANNMGDIRQFMCTWPQPKAGTGAGINNSFTKNELAQFPFRNSNDYLQGHAVASISPVPAGTPPAVVNAPATDTATPGANNEQIKQAGASLPAPKSYGDPLWAADGRVGTPESAPYHDYQNMSEAEIIRTEGLRRAGDADYQAQLTSMSPRAIWMDITQMESVKNFINRRMYEKRSRIEMQLAAISASLTDKFVTPQIQAAAARLKTKTSAAKVN